MNFHWFPCIAWAPSGLGGDLPDLRTLLPVKPQWWQLLGVPRPPCVPPASGTSHGTRTQDFSLLPRGSASLPTGFRLYLIAEIPPKSGGFVEFFTSQKLLIFTESKRVCALEQRPRMHCIFTEKMLIKTYRMKGKEVKRGRRQIACAELEGFLLFSAPLTWEMLRELGRAPARALAARASHGVYFPGGNSTKISRVPIFRR